MCIGRVLYDNVLARSDFDVTVGFTESEGFEKEHLYDYRDFTICRIPQGLTSTNFVRITNNSGAAVTVDTFAMLYSPGSVIDASLQVIHDLENSSGTSLLQGGGLQILPTTQNVLFEELAAPFSIPNGDYVQFEFQVTPSVGPNFFEIFQIFLGEELKLSVIDGNRSVGQWQGIAPPTLPGAVQPRNSFSVNGAFLGQNTRAQFRRGEIVIEQVVESWVRNNWVPFQIHAKSKTWFYSWNLESYPDEAVFCATPNGGISPPENTGPSNYMSVMMPYVATGQE